MTPTNASQCKAPEPATFDVLSETHEGGEVRLDIRWSDGQTTAERLSPRMHAFVESAAGRRGAPEGWFFEAGRPSVERVREHLFDTGWKAEPTRYPTLEVFTSEWEGVTLELPMPVHDQVVDAGIRVEQALRTLSGAEGRSVQAVRESLAPPLRPGMVVDARMAALEAALKEAAEALAEAVQVTGGSAQKRLGEAKDRARAALAF